MATYHYNLAEPPTDPRRRELWLQHAAGFIFWEDVRGWALGRLATDLSPESRAAAEAAIDETLYGLMMVLDGVTGSIGGEGRRVELYTEVRLVSGDPETIEAAVDLFRGDGMCMGYVGWRDGDFGSEPIATPRTDTP